LTLTVKSRWPRPDEFLLGGFAMFASSQFLTPPGVKLLAGKF
jgi:hypothetical protein